MSILQASPDEIERINKQLQEEIAYLRSQDNPNCPVHFTDLPQVPYDVPKYSGEIFLRVSDYLPEICNDPCIFISNYGRVYDAYKNKMKKTNMYIVNGNTNTYASFIYNGKSYPLHRVEVACFVDNQYFFDKKYQPDHINGIKNDNRINLFNLDNNNIEWVTRSENIMRAYNLGLSKTCEDNVHASISEETAKKVIALLLDEHHYTSKDIVNIIQDPNLTIVIVDHIRKRDVWARLSEGLVFDQRINRQFTEQDIHNFCKVFQGLVQEGSTLCIKDKCREALRRNGFEPSERFVETLRKVYVKKYYPHIVSQYNF